MSAFVVAVVDDDLAILKALGRLLRSIGLRPVTYASAGEFLADVSSEPVACLVADVQMPTMTGLDLQEVLLDAGQGLPLIFISGHESKAAEEIGLRNGAVAFLHKPFTDEEFLDALRQALPLANL